MAFGPLKATARLMWPLVKMSLIPLIRPYSSVAELFFFQKQRYHPKMFQYSCFELLCLAESQSS